MIPDGHRLTDGRQIDRQTDRQSNRIKRFHLLTIRQLSSRCCNNKFLNSSELCINTWYVESVNTKLTMVIFDILSPYMNALNIIWWYRLSRWSPVKYTNNSVASLEKKWHTKVTNSEILKFFEIHHPKSELPECTINSNRNESCESWRLLSEEAMQ